MVFPSLTNPHKLPAFLDTVRHAEIPQKFTYRFLEQLGFPSSSDRDFVPLLKFLGLLDQNSKPTQKYMAYRMDPSELPGFIETAYSKIYKLNSQVSNLQHAELVELFTRVSTVDKVSVHGFVDTFVALRRLVPDKVSEDNKVSKLPLTLNLNVSINSPEDLNGLLKFIQELS